MPARPPMDPELNLSMAIPDPLRGVGRLFLWAEARPRMGALRRLAEQHGRTFDTYDDEHCIAVHVAKGDIVRFLGRLRRELAPDVLKATRALFKTGFDEPSLSDFPRADTLEAFIAFARGKWLGEIISDGRLLVHYQPIVWASRVSRVYGFEALARARGRDGGLVSPTRMLSAARDADLLSSFDTHVHELAAQGFANARRAGKLFLNMAPTTALDSDVQLEHFRRLCRLYRLSHQDVVLELTESEKITDVEAARRIVGEAQDDGFQVALDDLGAGFSNLNLIHQLRPDTVKLDMALTRGIHEDDFKSVIAGKIIEIAHQLGINTVAEGIQTEDELRWFQDAGVLYVQGYLTGQPEELPGITADLHDGR